MIFAYFFTLVPAAANPYRLHVVGLWERGCAGAQMRIRNRGCNQCEWPPPSGCLTPDTIVVFPRSNPKRTMRMVSVICVCGMRHQICLSGTDCERSLRPRASFRGPPRSPRPPAPADPHVVRPHAPRGTVRFPTPAGGLPADRLP